MRHYEYRASLFSERRRNFAILEALGATGCRLGAFIWGEGWLVLLGCGAIGTLLGFGAAQVRVKVLTGVFDPPPEFLTIPWGYLLALATAAIASTVMVIVAMKRISCRLVVEELRNI